MNLGGVIHLNKTGICIVATISLILFIYIFSNKNPSISENLHTDQIDLRKLLIVAAKAAENGGIEVVSVKDSLKIENKGKTKEGLNDTVTTADFRSHCVMGATLKHHFPDILLVSEEAKTKCDEEITKDFKEGTEGFEALIESWIPQKDVTIWIDPLDATKEYTENLQQYVTTMVCIAVKGVPIIGVIHKPFSKETFWAWVGNGKSSNLKPTARENNTKLKFIISMSHSGQIKEVLQKNFKDFEIITAAGSGYKVLEVISGKADAYLHNTNIKKWDICAGNAILNAVGGKMTTKENGLINYADIADPVNTKGLIATLKNHEKFIDKL